MYRTSNIPNPANGKMGTVDKDITAVKVGQDTFKMTSTTNVWIFVNDNGKADSVKKMTFSEYTLNTKDLSEETVQNTKDVEVYAYTKNAAVKDLVIVQPDKAVDAFQVGDKAKVTGFVTGITKIRKTDGTETDVLNTIKMTLADGSKVSYTGDGEYTGAGLAKNTVVTVEYYKSNDLVTGATPIARSGQKSIYAVKDYSNDTLTMTDGFKVIPDEDCLIQEVYTEGGNDAYKTTTVEEITSSNCGWTVDYWSLAEDTHTDDAAVVNFVVVRNDGTTAAATTAATAAAKNVVLNLKSDGFGEGTAPTGVNNTDYTYTYTITPRANPAATAPTATFANGDTTKVGYITTTAGTNPTAAATTIYDITVRATDRATGSYAEQAWVLTLMALANGSFDTSSTLVKAQ